MNIHVARMTKRNALAFTCYHGFHPERHLPFALFVQVFEVAYMVHLNTLFTSTYLTCVIEQPFDYLRSHFWVCPYDLIFYGVMCAMLE